MKKKITHYHSVHISTDAFTAQKLNKKIVKVRIGTQVHDTLICEFYVPISAVDIGAFISDKIVRARALHDFKITFDYWSGGTIREI